MTCFEAHELKYHDFGSSTSTAATSNIYVDSSNMLPLFPSPCIELTISLISLPLILCIFLGGLLHSLTQWPYSLQLKGLLGRCWFISLTARLTPLNSFNFFQLLVCNC